MTCIAHPFHRRASLRHTPLLLATACLALLTLTGCPEGDTPRQTPVLDITYPEQGQLIPTRRVQVKGTAEHTEEVMVNGSPASVVGGRWTAEVALEEGKEVVVEVTARGAQDAVTFAIDASPPALEVTSPQRASFLPTENGDRVTVAGVATDSASSITELSINALPIELGADGAFTFDYPLEVGLNTLHIVALDEAGHTSDTTIGLIHGDFVNPTERIDPGLDFTIDKSIFPKITDVIAALITPAQITSLVSANLDPESQVSLESIAFDPLDIEAVPRSNVESNEPGFISFSITASNVELKGAFALGQDEKIELDVNLTEATVTTSMTLVANDSGGLDISFSQPMLTIADDALTWNVRAGGSDLSNEDSRLLSNLVDTIVELAFSEILSEQVIEQLYDPALLHRRVELLGRTLEFELRLEEIITNASGVFVRTSFAMPADAFPEVPEAPGALHLPPGPTAIPGIERDAIITGNADAFNRLLHGVWRSGLLNQRLTGKDFAGFELPFALETGALATALDGRISNHAETNSPAGVVLRPQLPPVLEFRAAEETGAEGDQLVARLGEVHVDLILDADKTSPKKLATFALFMDLGVELEIVNDNKFAIALSFEGSTDLIDEPLFDFDDQDVEELMQGIFALIPSLLSEKLLLDGEADVAWIKLTQPQLSIHGIDKDQLSFGLSIEAKPEGISLP